jgi:hypothetical protein
LAFWYFAAQLPGGSMRKLLVLVFVLLLVSACGGSTDPSGGSETTGISTTESVTESVTTESVTESSELELAGGATFNGTFATEPGVGPGAISFVLDGEGKLIVSAIIDPALKEFACPTGVIISGGGISGTYNPGIAKGTGVGSSIRPPRLTAPTAFRTPSTARTK